MQTPGRLILIVDPDADTRAMYGAALQACGFAIAEVGNGREALAKVFAVAPSAVVTASRLPFIDGYELCRILAHDDVTSGVPLILLSGDAQADQLERAWQAGADIVLTKPFLPETLVEAVCRLVDRSAAGARTGRSAMARATLAPQAPRERKMRAHERHDTTRPPLLPPSLPCPSCDRPLAYEQSHIGGVNAQQSEQWDYFRCATCGAWEYRQRTRTLRRVKHTARG